jgi:hypothetical protein
MPDTDGFEEKSSNRQIFSPPTGYISEKSGLIEKNML